MDATEDGDRRDRGLNICIGIGCKVVDFDLGVRGESSRVRKVAGISRSGGGISKKREGSCRREKEGLE